MATIPIVNEILSNPTFYNYIEKYVEINSRPVTNFLAEPQETLDWTIDSIFANKTAPVMGSIIDFSATHPMLSLPGLGSMIHNIIKMGNKFSISGKELAEMISFSQRGDAAKKAYEYITEKVMRCVKTPQERNDFLSLYQLSTGKMKVDVANNQFGAPIAEFDIGIPTANKHVALTANWGGATSKVITNITEIADASEAAGNRVTRMITKAANISKFLLSDEVKGMFSSTVFSAPQLIQVQEVNAVLERQNLPTFWFAEYTNKEGKVRPFNVANKLFKYETKSRTIVTTSPFSDNNVVFLTDAKPVTLYYKKPLESEYALIDYKKMTVDNTLIYQRFGKDEVVEDVWGYVCEKMPVVYDPQSIHLLNTQSTTSF